MRVCYRSASERALTDAEKAQDCDDRIGDHHADRESTGELAVDADIENVDQQAGNQEDQAGDQCRNACDILQGVTAHGHLRAAVSRCQQNIGAKDCQCAPESSECRVGIVRDHTAARKHCAQL